MQCSLHRKKLKGNECDHRERNPAFKALKFLLVFQEAALPLRNLQKVAVHSMALHPETPGLAAGLLAARPRALEILDRAQKVWGQRK